MPERHLVWLGSVQFFMKLLDRDISPLVLIMLIYIFLVAYRLRLMFIKQSAL